MNIDTLLAKYGSHIDWRNKEYWNCNEKKFPNLPNKYIAESGLRMSAHPFETVFFKPIYFLEDGRQIADENYFLETFAYLEWAVMRKRKQRFRY
jgi:hypothetical protein